MSDDENDGPAFFFMKRAEFVPRVSPEEFENVSKLLEKSNECKSILSEKREILSGPVKRGKRKVTAAKKCPADPEIIEDITNSSDSSQAGLSAAVKRRLKKSQQERATELKLIEAANRQVLTAANYSAFDEIEEVPVDTSESNVSIILTISYMSEIARLRCYENEKFSTIFPKVADLFKLKASELLLCLREQNIKVDDTPKTLNITLDDTIECIPYKADNIAAMDGVDKLKILFQSSDSKEKITLLVHKLEKMQEVMARYSDLRSIPLDKLIFEFDGERIEDTQTPEDLDMECGNCIDVKIIASDSTINQKRKKGRGRRSKKGRSRERGARSR